MEKVMNFNPSLVACGRGAKTQVKIVLGQWTYRKEFVIECCSNIMGFDLFEYAVELVYDQLPSAGDVVHVVLVDEDGIELLCEDEEDRGDDWVKEMVVSMETISITEV